jgi:hypothetical protein
MTNDTVTFSGKTILVSGKPIHLDYPVANAFQLGDKLVVLLDPDAYTEKFGQFRNLIALTLDGKLLWTAELPTNMGGDTYYRVSSKDPLVADSFSSYACKIDDTTGKIKAKSFFK